MRNVWCKWVGWTAMSAALVLWTGCGGLDQGTKPELGVFVGDDGTEDLTYELASVIPGSGLDDRVTVQVRNKGDEALVITAVRLLTENEDGTLANPWVSIDWAGFNPTLGFPLTLEVDDFVTNLKFDVVYKPGSCNDGAACLFTNATTLEFVSNDLGKADSVRRIVFSPPSCSVLPQVKPPSDTYFNATSSQPETKIFQIENGGECETKVTDVKFGTPTNKFTLKREWVNGTTLLGKFEADYAPLLFEVTYRPTGDGGADSTKVFVYTEAQPNSPIEVPLTSKQEEGSFQVSYCTDTLGYVDFTDVGSGESTCVVNIYNQGPAGMTVQGITVPEDPDHTHYTLSAELVKVPPQVIPDAEKDPIGLKADSAVEITVTYQGSLEGLNGTLNINYTNPNFGTIQVPMFGGSAKSCFDVAPGDGASPLVLQFVTEKGTAVERDFVIYNCGNAPLTVNGFRFENAFQQPTAYWTMVGDAVSGDIVIPVGGLERLTVSMLVDDGELTPTGVLYVDYLDGSGVQVQDYGISLSGQVGTGITPPTAMPTSSGDGTVGQQHELSGLSSTPGSEGISEQGYVWMLLAKPANSQVIVNGGAGKAVRSWVPDQAGTYTFGLMVHGASGSYLYSDLATIDVQVN